MQNFGGLKCSSCGASLVLRVGFDGDSEAAARFSEHDREWGWSVSLDCSACARVYPVCRTPDIRYISAEREL